MADETWQALSQAVTYAANKHMIDVFNASASTRFIRIYGIVLLNNQTSAVTGVLNTGKINIVNAAPAGGSTLTPIAMDTGNAALNANTTAGVGRTHTIQSTVRQLVHSGDEPTVGTLDWDSIQCIVPWSTWWNVGYGDTSVQPLTLRPSEDRGVSLQSLTQTVGAADLEILFTNKAT